MKNLKKILSLSLAVVMLLGMMIMPASAADSKMTYADLVDKDDIKNLSEVALLVDLGIIEGKTGGVYDPTGIVDRATMAKVVTTLHFGAADASQFLGTTSDLIDINGNWAEGYILYCYTQNIIAGDGLGKFFPSNQVTVAEAAKMLLVALGYDPIKAGLVGSDWAVNTISLATRAGILSGTGLQSNAKLDRDTLAKMMYNTLFAQQVAYNTLFGNEPIGKNNSLGLASYGLVKVTGLVVYADDKYVEIKISETDPKSWTGTKRFDLGNQQAFIGQYATIYVQAETEATENSGWNLAASLKVKGTKVVSIYSSELTKAEGNVMGVNVEGTAFSKLIDKNDSKYIGTLQTSGVGGNSDTPADFFVNGRSTTQAAVVAAAGTKGVIVTFYDNDGNGYADVVDVIVYTYAQITSKNTNGDGSLSFTTTFRDNAGAVVRATSKNTANFADLEKDDYVYGFVDVNGNIVLFTPDVVEGTVRSKTSSKFTVGSTSYELVPGSVTAFGDVSINSDVEVYIVPGNGYAMAVEIINEDLNYALVVAANSAGNIGTQGAKLLFVDGTTATVNVSKVTNPTGASGASTIETGFSENGPTYVLVTYAVKADGTYELKTVAASATATGETIENKKANSIGGRVVNNATTFIVKKSGATYVGFNAVPSMNNATIVYNHKDGAVVFAFVVDATATSDDTFVIYDRSAYVNYIHDGSSYYEYKAIVKGKLTVVYTDAILTAIGNYTINTFDVVDGKDVIQTGTMATPASITGSNVVYSTRDVVGNAGGTFAANGDTQYVYLKLKTNGSGDYEATEAGMGTIVNSSVEKSPITIYANSDAIAELVLIFEEVSVAPAVTGVTFSTSPATVAAGLTGQYTAAANVVFGAATTVNYSITGNAHAGTTISATGLLTVHADETATTIKVTATSTFDNTKKAEHDVTISPYFAPDVTGITIAPATATVAAGGTETFTATVIAVGGASTAVTYTVTGNADVATVIDATTGVLTVAAGETATTLTVTATSDFDNTQTADATVTV